jgi:hypothetical protein
LEERQWVEFIVFIIKNDVPLNLRMYPKPRENFLTPGLVRQIRYRVDKRYPVVFSAENTCRIETPARREHHGRAS